MSVSFRASQCSCIILAMHRLFPLLEGSQLAQHASPDEAHRAVDSSSCGLSHHGAGVLAQLRRKRWILSVDEPSVAVLTGAEFPLTPPTTRGGGM